MDKKKGISLYVIIDT